MKPVIDTKRLNLAPAVRSDLDELCRLFWEEDVRRYLCDGKVVPRDEIEVTLEKSKALDDDGLGFWVIRLPDRDFVGCVALLPVGEAGVYNAKIVSDIEPLIALFQDYWGQGYATEALTALTSYAFRQLRLTRLVAAVDEPNQGSHRLMDRVGFAKTGLSEGPKYRLVYYERPAASQEV